jgi:hypothetical protein
VADRLGAVRARIGRARERIDGLGRFGAADQQGARTVGALSAVYYAGLTALLLMAVTDTLGTVLSAELAKDFREDSEALVLAIGLPAWIQFVRPRLTGRRWEWPATLLTAVALLSTGSWMHLSADGLVDAVRMSDEVSTLSEPVVAMAALVPYVQLRRPMPRRGMVAFPAAVVLVVLLAPDSGLVVRAPELLAMLLLVPIGLDVVDRRILEPAAGSNWFVRWSWSALLLLTPLLLSLFLRDAFTGTPGQAIRNAVNAQEAWLGVLLVQLYFAVRFVLQRRDPVRSR